MNQLFQAVRSSFSGWPSGEGPRVLIAEDYVDLANITATLLRRCGFDVRTVQDGRMVLALVRSFRPHFVLMDVKLPGLNGYEVAEQIRADRQLQQTQIIGVSAYRPEPRVGLPLKAHFDHYLTKPFDIRTLLQLLCPG